MSRHMRDNGQKVVVESGSIHWRGLVIKVMSERVYVYTPAEQYLRNYHFCWFSVGQAYDKLASFQQRLSLANNKTKLQTYAYQKSIQKTG